MSTLIERLGTEVGEEYPQALTWNGVRMGLREERDFSRVYTSDDGKNTFVVSRFMDGSASITFPEVQAAWPSWSDHQRFDFSRACGWLVDRPDLPEFPDLPDILRFVMHQRDRTHVSWVAHAVAHRLPRDEAFTLLSEALRATNGDGTANITGAIAYTKHPAAMQVLIEHLEGLWGEDDLWKDDPFTNQRAFDATCCIARLLELGATPETFEDKVRRLAAHLCVGNRNACSTHLQAYYPWLPKRVIQRQGA